MKYLQKNRRGFTFPDYVAYCAVAAAMRPFRRAKHYAVALRVPEGLDTDVYYRAAEAMMNPNPLAYVRASHLPLLFDSARPPRSLADAMEALGRDRAIVVVKGTAALPDDMLAAIDAAVDMRSPKGRDVVGVVRWLYGTDMDAASSEKMAGLSFRRMAGLMRPGRPMSRVIARLNQEPSKRDSATAPLSDAPLDLRLESMAGYGEAKQWGLNLARDVADWRAGIIGWHDVDKGLLLSGPPGSGKTIFAGALAATCDMKVIYASAARWQAKGHLNDMLKAMFKAFDDAKKAAPSILFIDEVDAFGSRDGDNGQNENYIRQVINGLLECLDGVGDREGVVVVGACNNPRVLDPAIVRAGRLDHHIRIPLPDEETRAAILRMHLRGDLPADDFIEFSREMAGASGADIAKIVREARRIARQERRGMVADDIRRVLPKKYMLSEPSMRALAVHEIGHAVVGVAVGLTLVDVAIQDSARLDGRRHPVGGARFENPVGERRTKQHYLDRVCLYMAGIAAEELFVGGFDDGAGGSEGSDLNEATNLVLTMEAGLGMGRFLATFATVDDNDIDSFRRMNPALMGRVDVVLREQLEHARSIIEENRAAVTWLWEHLLERKNIVGEEVREAMRDGARSIRHV